MIGRSKISEEELQRLEDELRRRAVRDVESLPPDPYWSNSIVRVNQKIDEATSGKSLSLSWALRVAIPGVVAIITFLVGLDYYIPDKPAANPSMKSFFLSLSPAIIDSLDQVGDGGLTTELTKYPSVNSFTNDQIAEYFISVRASEDVVETLSEEEFDSLLRALGASGKTTVQ